MRRGDTGQLAEMAWRQESAPTAGLSFARPVPVIERLPSGALVLSVGGHDLPAPRCIGEHLIRWARETPDHPFVGERDGDEWRVVTHAEALRRVQKIATALLQRGLSTHSPVLVLSDNSVRFALLSLACMHVGIPIAACSSAYSLVSSDFAKLRGIVDLLSPGLIYAEQAEQFSRALRAIAVDGVQVVTADGAFPGSVTFESLEQSEDVARVSAAYSEVGPDTVAKFLFTSGSTGTPKAVINTQRMLCSNQEAKAVAWPFLEGAKPVVVDWLPWSHTFGANYVFNMVLRNGGTFYIDAGRPHKVGPTIEALRRFSPTIYFNVPKGYDTLLAHLESDEGLRRSFFRNLKAIHFAGAALPSSTRERLARLVAQQGSDAEIISSWGATETGPGATTCYGESEVANSIGLPIPGVSLKLVPDGGRFEVRVRGPNVTPGYWKSPELTAAAFDEDGYYRMGDAVRFIDDARPELGLKFEGRVSENFKLTTGTWVVVGNLRLAVIAACAPVVQDAVITGHDRDEVGALLFLNGVECERFLESKNESPATSAALRAFIAERLNLALRGSAGSAGSVKRVILQDVPPSLDAGEITDKGYINQSAVLANRAVEVERLYAAAPDAAVVVCSA
jgi:feruloyl-CoA synthase